MARVRDKLACQRHQQCPLDAWRDIGFAFDGNLLILYVRARLVCCFSQHIFIALSVHNAYIVNAHRSGFYGHIDRVSRRSASADPSGTLSGAPLSARESPLLADCAVRNASYTRHQRHISCLRRQHTYVPHIHAYIQIVLRKKKSSRRLGMNRTASLYADPLAVRRFWVVLRILLDVRFRWWSTAHIRCTVEDEAIYWYWEQTEMFNAQWKDIATSKTISDSVLYTRTRFNNCTSSHQT